MREKRKCSRAYWEKYISSIIESVEEDKDTIIDMLMYGCLESAKITLNISLDEAPSYTVEINKFGEKSPFGDEEDDK